MSEVPSRRANSASTPWNSATATGTPQSRRPGCRRGPRPHPDPTAAGSAPAVLPATDPPASSSPRHASRLDALHLLLRQPGTSGTSWSGDAGGGDGDTVDNRRERAPRCHDDLGVESAAVARPRPIAAASRSTCSQDYRTTHAALPALRCWFALAAAMLSGDVHQFAGHVRQVDAGAQRDVLHDLFQDRVVVGRRPCRQRGGLTSVSERSHPPR